MPKKKTQKKATNHPTRETTTELISWGTRVLPRGIVGAQSFATNHHNVYFLMKDGTVKSLIPEINSKHYKAMPNNLAGITQITAVGDYGFALSNSGEMFSWGGNEKLKNKLLSATFGKVSKIIVQEAKSSYTYNTIVVCILKNGTAKSWMAYENDEYRKITERIEGIKNLVDFQWAGDYLMILNEQGELTLLEEEWGEEELKEHKYSGVQCACVSEDRDPAFVDKSGEIYQGYPTSFPRKGTGNKKNKFNRISHILDYKARCGWVSDVTYLLDEKGNLSSLSSETDDPWYEIPEGLDNVIQFGQWGGIVIALRQTQETLPSKVQRKNNHEDDTTPIPKLNSQHKSLILNH